MKKIFLITAALTLIMAGCAGCAQNTAPTEPETQPETQPQLHTVAPMNDTDSEPEWGYVDCDIAVVNSENETVLSKNDFEAVAVSASGENAALLFRVTSQGADVMAATGEETLAVTLDGEKIGSLNPQNITDSEFTLAGDYTYEEICDLATRIRGLE